MASGQRLRFCGNRTAYFSCLPVKHEEMFGVIRWQVAFLRPTEYNKPQFLPLPQQSRRKKKERTKRPGNLEDEMRVKLPSHVRTNSIKSVVHGPSVQTMLGSINIYHIYLSCVHGLVLSSKTSGIFAVLLKGLSK